MASSQAIAKFATRQEITDVLLKVISDLRSRFKLPGVYEHESNFQSEKSLQSHPLTKQAAADSEIVITVVPHQRSVFEEKQVNEITNALNAAVQEVADEIRSNRYNSSVFPPTIHYEADKPRLLPNNLTHTIVLRLNRDVETTVLDLEKFRQSVYEKTCNNYAYISSLSLSTAAAPSKFLMLENDIAKTYSEELQLDYKQRWESVKENAIKGAKKGALIGAAAVALFAGSLFGYIHLSEKSEKGNDNIDPLSDPADKAAPRTKIDNAELSEEKILNSQKKAAGAAR